MVADEGGAQGLPDQGLHPAKRAESRVLLVGSDADTEQLLVAELAGSCSVIPVRDGAAALTQARSATPPDLIVFDAAQPQLDVVELCRLLKRSPLTRRIPMLLIVGQPDEAEIAAYLQAGINDVLRRPLSASILRARALNCIALADQTRLLDAAVHTRTRELSDAARRLEEEVQASQQALDRAEFLTNYDALTSLPNRHQWIERAERAIKRAAGDREPLAMIAVNLDRFHQINDLVGHAEADRLLVEIARRLQRWVRSTDLLGRVGADEFTVLLPGGEFTSEAALLDSAEQLGARMLQAVAEPFALAGQDVTVTASAGIAVFPDDGDSAAALLRSAGAAVVHAKAAGRNQCARFQPAMLANAGADYGLESRLRKAIQDGELALYYQPQVEIESGRIFGAEALLRWKLADGSYVSPAGFVPVAEEAGMIGLLDDYVLRAVCHQAAAWRAIQPDFRIAVNLGAQWFQSRDVVGYVSGCLAEAGALPQNLELEITEHALITDVPSATERLVALRKLGIGIALDDFGTGYSSLAYLKRLPIDQIKIDQSFIRDLEKDADDAALVRAIIRLGDILGLVAVAEGVETPGQLQFLRDEGCTRVQGWLYSPAVPAGEMDVLLRAGRMTPLPQARGHGRREDMTIGP